VTGGRVAIIAVGELFGGAERHILGLGAFLREQDLDPQVILFHDRELAARCREDGLPVHVLHTRGAFDRTGPERLSELFDRLDIGLVHVHGYKAAVNTALTKRRLATCATLHGQGEPSWRQGFPFVKDRCYRALEVWACRRRRAVVCFVTADLQKRHGRRYGNLAQRVVHNGIDPLHPLDFPTRPDILLPGRLHAVMVGRLTPVKGIDIALSALARVTTDVPWHLNLVGEGTRQAELEDLVVRLNLRDRVSFLGFRRDVHALLAHSDLLIMSSRHEGLPYALLEAMSLGLPTLASDVGGLAEVLHHNRTGWLAPVGDIAAFAVALAKLGADSTLRRRLGRNAAEVQRRSYTLEAMGEGYLEAYAAVLSAGAEER
jgi:L-malate glycosyltransferase